MIRLLLLALCLLPFHVNAQITLPFSTTFDCAEQSQNDVGTWVTCDGIFQNGGWRATYGAACNLQGSEQITSAANYSGGGGGRGQRHAVGHSGAIGSGSCVENNTNGSGSLGYEFTARVEEIFVRWYVRWETGLRLGNPSGGTRNHKVIYFTGSNCGTGINGCYFDLKGVNFSFVFEGTSYDTAGGWDELFGCSGQTCASDGRWIAFEIYMKNATGGGTNNDGIVRWWVDGVLKMQHTNVNFNGSNGFLGFVHPENHQFDTPQDDLAISFEDIDDVAISTTGPIGQLGASAPDHARVVVSSRWRSGLRFLALPGELPALVGAALAALLMGGYLCFKR